MADDCGLMGTSEPGARRHGDEGEEQGGWDQHTLSVCENATDGLESWLSS